MRRPRNNSAREPATQARQTPKALLRCEQTHLADPWHARNSLRHFRKAFATLRHRTEQIARIRVPGAGLRTRGGGHPVNRHDDYRQHALECVRLANDTHESGTKAALIDMAQAWIKLAEQAQRNRQLATNQDALERPVPIA